MFCMKCTCPRGRKLYFHVPVGALAIVMCPVPILLHYSLNENVKCGSGDEKVKDLLNSNNTRNNIKGRNCI